MKAILGTAGHIDHGKSALVRALTGMETDRLPEERERGISIELGFAHIELGDSDAAGIVDVPGHERFLRQMLAGAHGFDLVLVVVAADDGVMPQTEEHFEIVHLLGVRDAVFVITKSDLADDARIADVRDEIAILSVGTAFEDAPVVAVSAVDGRGIDELRAVIAERLSELGRGDTGGRFRMPVDRAFVVKGHGVVVTGTALAGSVAAGDELQLLPGTARARVREVQVHGAAVERGAAGQRVALNLAGCGRDDVRRGHTAVAPGSMPETGRFDANVEVRPLAGREVRSHDRVRVYVGTQELTGKLVWLDRRPAVEPRQRHYAQIVLDEPAALGRGDRFVIRDETASRTLGGGAVVLAAPPRHRPSKGEVCADLATLESGEPLARIEAYLTLMGELGAPASTLAEAVGVASGDVERLAADGSVVGIPAGPKPSLVTTVPRYAAYVDAIVDAVTGYLEANSGQPGVELEHLRMQVRPRLEQRLFRDVVDRIVADGRLVRRDSVLRVAGHEARLDDADVELGRRVREALANGAIKPPTLRELADATGADSRRLLGVLAVLVERGEAMKVAADLYYDPDALARVAGALTDYLRERGEIGASDFRDLIDASRKYCIPLLTYFDSAGLTLRVGDVRKLRAP